MPGVVCPDPPAPSPASSPPSTPVMAATTLPPSTEAAWPPSAPEHPVSTCQDSESGIEDSAEILEGGNMPLSPPIPIPSPRRSSLQNFHTQVSPPAQADKSSSAPATAQESDAAQQPRASTPKPQAAGEDARDHINGSVEEEAYDVPTIQISEVRTPVILVNLDR